MPDTQPALTGWHTAIEPRGKPCRASGWMRQLHGRAVAPVVALQAQGQATQGRDLSTRTFTGTSGSYACAGFSASANSRSSRLADYLVHYASIFGELLCQTTSRRHRKFFRLTFN